MKVKQTKQQMKAFRRQVIIGGFLAKTYRSRSRLGDLSVLDDILDERGDTRPVKRAEARKVAKMIGLQLRFDGLYLVEVEHGSLKCIKDAIKVARSQIDGDSDDYARVWKSNLSALNSSKKNIMETLGMWIKYGKMALVKTSS